MEYPGLEYEGEYSRGDWYEQEERIYNRTADTLNGECKFDWRDSNFFVATGGRLFENLLFRALIDSLYSLNTVPPDIRDAGTEAQRHTRYRARWAAGETIRRTVEAREWVLNELPGHWGMVFQYPFSTLEGWIRDKWNEIDVHPGRATSIRRLVSECLIERSVDNE